MSCLSSPLLFYLTAWSERDDSFLQEVPSHLHTMWHRLITSLPTTANKLCFCHMCYMLCRRESFPDPTKCLQQSDVCITRQIYICLNARVVLQVRAIDILFRFNPPCLIIGLVLAWCWCCSLRQTAPFSFVWTWPTYNRSPTETQSMKPRGVCCSHTFFHFSQSALNTLRSSLVSMREGLT